MNFRNSSVRDHIRDQVKDHTEGITESRRGLLLRGRPTAFSSVLNVDVNDGGERKKKKSEVRKATLYLPHHSIHYSSYPVLA